MAGVPNSRPAGCIRPAGRLNLARGDDLEMAKDRLAVPRAAKTGCGEPRMPPTPVLQEAVQAENWVGGQQGAAGGVRPISPYTPQPAHGEEL